MIHSDWIWGFGGGLMIGLAASAYLLMNGKIMGISGIFGGLVDRTGWGDWANRLAFIAGLVGLPWLMTQAMPAQTHLTGNWLIIVAGGLLVGKAPMQTLTASLGDIIGTSQGQGMLLAIIGTGVIGCSVFEAALGRTPGKFLANCQVVRLVRGANDVAELRNPSLAQALVRNLIKWIFPPVAFVIFRDGAQHRGEQYSKTAVIVPWVEELDDEEED
jgi:hypothetical protein